MDSQTPVSILMPLKNGIEFLPAAMSTILENARPFDEILLIDDNSIDGSLKFCEKWASQDSRVNLISNPGTGLVSALNVGLGTSTHSLIARFDVDDTYSATRISSQVSKLSSVDVAIFSDYNFVDSHGEFLGNFPSPVFPHAVSVSLINNRRTAHPSVIFRREAVVEVGGYREEDYLVEDLSLWLRLSRIGNLVSVPETLLNYRISPSGVSSRNRKRMVSQKNLLLRTIGINSPDIRKSIDCLQETLKANELLENPGRRSLLHLMELKACLRQSQIEHAQKADSFIIAKNLTRPSFLRISAGLIYEKIQRGQAKKGGEG
jgi:glycosyltransferase involved in cell wall biosynthesis